MIQNSIPSKLPSANFNIFLQTVSQKISEVNRDSHVIHLLYPYMNNMYRLAVYKMPLAL